jgi:beta-galactosidase
MRNDFMRSVLNNVFGYILLLWMPVVASASEGQSQFAVSLNGIWQTGFSRNYIANAQVPGISIDPSKMNTEKLWYKKEVVLPKGDWQYATLELKGARFLPEVFVNGASVSKQAGGMAPTFHLLQSKDVKPGNTITLEIALSSLKDIPSTDASYIPPADQWRSNIASCLWDDVILHLHGATRIDRIVPFVNFKESKADIHFDLLQLHSATLHGKAQLEITDQKGKLLMRATKPLSGLNNTIAISYKNKLQVWSPEHPVVYQLCLTVLDEKNKVTDERIIPFGIKEFATKNKRFYLNNQPCTPRGATVVWHRWVRSQEGRELGFDTAWFAKNIVQRSKDYGANYLRFHLGKPPERLLDLCDKYGLLVQYEWSFFHGMPATKESLLEQYRYWLDAAMRHPSVALVHPYNETEGDQLKTVWEALDSLLKNYPPLVMEERDVIHVHKYWWSLFENLGLYYDDASQFPKTIMVDEFGGNYLDEKGDLGGYKSLKESYMRFLGRTHTAEERLDFHAMANARVAEYWRRINAAGYAPFCALGSWEDGNNWFLGKLKEGNPKPVWNELTAAFSPQSVSLDIWDRNFTPAEKISLPVYLFNDTERTAKLKIRLSLVDGKNQSLFDTVFEKTAGAFSRQVHSIPFTVPGITGGYIVKAELLNRPSAVKYPVISQWPIHVFQATVTADVQQIKIGIPDEEKEIKQFLNNHNIITTSINDATANVILTSLNTWKKIAQNDRSLLQQLQSAIDKGTSIVMLDAGERYLGQGYPAKSDDLGPLQGVARITDPKITSYDLFKGVSLTFTEAAEPESHLHADKNNDQLWKHLPKQYTWLWNGMRGGLLAPAADMDFHGLSADAFLSQWKARGADENAIKNSSYYAYELQGFYAFSMQANDAAVQKKLKEKVAFLVEDAPALANAINPLTPVKITDLSQEYQFAKNGQAQRFTPLANCGKNLTRTPVALIEFGEGKGKLIVSQLLTAGRLAKSFGEEGFYGIRYDETAVQMVLNMLQVAAQKK